MMIFFFCTLEYIFLKYLYLCILNLLKFLSIKLSHHNFLLNKQAFYKIHLYNMDFFQIPQLYQQLLIYLLFLFNQQYHHTAQYLEKSMLIYEFQALIYMISYISLYHLHLDSLYTSVICYPLSVIRTYSFGVYFSPVIFSAQNRLTSELLRYL